MMRLWELTQTIPENPKLCQSGWKEKRLYSVTVLFRSDRRTDLRLNEIHAMNDSFVPFGEHKQGRTRRRIIIFGVSVVSVAVSQLCEQSKAW